VRFFVAVYSKDTLHKNNIPSSGSDNGAAVRRGEMEPLFLQVVSTVPCPPAMCFIRRSMADGGMSEQPAA